MHLVPPLPILPLLLVLAAPVAASAPATSTSVQGDERAAPPRFERVLQVEAPDDDVWDPVAWRGRLVDPDHVARERAFEELVSLARARDEVRAFLAELANGAPTELAWTARLALRESERRAAEHDAERLDPSLTLRLHGGGSKDLGGLSRLEICDVDLRVALPRAAEGTGDPLVGLWSALPGEFAGESGALLVEVGDELENLRSELFLVLEESGQRFEGRLVDQLGALALPGVPGVVAAEDAGSRCVRIESDGRKVRVEVTCPDAAAGPSVYEGSSVDAILEAHPEVRALLPDGERRVRGHVAVPVRTDVLGVVVHDELTSAVGARLGLEPGLGVRVKDTLPNTVAKQLNVSQGSVLVELNGVALRSGDDITSAMGRRGSAEAVTLTWYDPTGERLCRRWTPTRRVLVPQRVAPPAPLEQD